jgi:hypothetical protein
MVWQDNNCAKCIKYENESTDEENAKCKMAFNIDLGFISGSIPLRIAKEIGCIYNPLYQSVRLDSKCSCFSDNEYPF